MKINGPMSLLEIEEHLIVTNLPLRLAVNSPTGWPMVVSLWFVYDKGNLFCATKRQARIASSIAKSSRCAFEVARETAPYFGVRGQGVASISSENAPEMLERLANRYISKDRAQFKKWLLKSSEDEVVISIRPVAFHSWDYRKRMAA